MPILPTTIDQWRELVSAKDVRKAEGKTGEDILQNVLHRNGKSVTSNGETFFDDKFDYKKLSLDDKLKLTLAVREELLEMGPKAADKLKLVDATLNSLTDAKQQELNQARADKVAAENDRLGASFQKDASSDKAKYGKLVFDDKTHEAKEWNKDSDQAKAQILVLKTADETKNNTIKPIDVTAQTAAKAKLDAATIPDIATVNQAQAAIKESVTVQSFINSVTSDHPELKIGKAGKALSDGKVGVYSLVALNDAGNDKVADKFMENIGLDATQKKFITDLKIDDKGNLKITRDGTDRDLNTDEVKQYASLQKSLKAKYTHGGNDDVDFNKAITDAKTSVTAGYQTEITHAAEVTATKKPKTPQQLEDQAKAEYEAQRTAYNTALKTKQVGEATIPQPMQVNEYIKQAILAPEVAAGIKTDTNKVLGQIHKIVASGEGLNTATGNNNGIDSEQELQLAKLAKSIGMEMTVGRDKGGRDAFHFTTGKVDMGTVGEFVTGYGSDGTKTDVSSKTK